MKIRVLTDLVKGYQKGQIVVLGENDPMMQFWRNRLSDDDGFCELIAEEGEE